MALKRIAVGTLVSSHFVAFNASSGTTQSTTVTFSNPVLGIVFMNGSSAWAASDSLGLSGGPPVFALPAATNQAKLRPFLGIKLPQTAASQRRETLPGSLQRGAPLFRSQAPLTLLCFGLAVPLLRRRKS